MRSRLRGGRDSWNGKSRQNPDGASFCSPVTVAPLIWLAIMSVKLLSLKAIYPMKSDKNTPEKTQKIEVLMLPSFPENPYQVLLGRALNLRGVEVSYLPYSHGKFPIFRAAIARKNKDEIDIIHLHWIHAYLQRKNKVAYTFLCLKLLLDVILTRISGIKIVWTVHNLMSHDDPFPGLELWTRRALANSADRIIFMSQFSLDNATKKYKIDPVKPAIIPHGNYRNYYPPTIEKSVARSELKLPEKGKIYLHIGMLKPYKGTEEMLEVWQKNRDYFEGDTLLIVGKPYNEEYGEKIKKMTDKMEGVILDLRFVKNDKISLYFSAADLVILPFKNILNSGSLLLAMSYGKPIVAPRLGSIEEVLQEADSLLYDPQDESGLAQAWQKSTQIDLEKLGDIVAKVCDRYDWDRIAEQTLQVYLSTLKSEKYSSVK